ncbi:MAG: POT-type proton-dependent oligopeptide transporter [Planctomycetales bacterium]|jgi:POT family proton-dependent oligopeptide transporter
MAKYLTAPDPNETGWPKGVKYIIGNEGCERFSFYGMKSILQVHLTTLFVAGGMYEQLGEENAQEMVHLFVAGVYAFPMIGAIIADRLLGKYHTILWLSLVYCLGHLVLSIGENSIGGMAIGLGLIAIGSGGIKPCVSAHVGDQFGKGNWNLVGRVFQAFYFIINFGSFFATLMIPFIRSSPDKIWILRDHPEYATSVAFAIPGILMFLATIAFWMGRKVFVHVPAHPGGKVGLLDSIGATLLFMGFIGLPLFGWGVLSFSTNVVLTLSSVLIGLWVFEERQAIEQDDGFLAVMFHSVEALFKGDNRKTIAALDSEVAEDSIHRHWFFSSAAKRFGEEAAEGPRAVLRIISIFFLVSVFWALFDQHASSWVRQAQRMNLDLVLPWSTSGADGKSVPAVLSMLPSQISALNPLMVMALIPFNTFFLYPFITKRGWEMTPLRRMTIGMLTASLAFVVVAMIQVRINAGGDEDMISVLWQFFPYLIMTQAEVMVSITGLEFAYTQAPTRMKSTIMGFWLLSVSLGNKLTAVVTKLPDMDLLISFWAFAALMGVAAVLFGIRSAFYKYRYYTQ